MPDNVARMARCLRKRPTEAERFLWSRLRAKQLEGLKFRRQEPVKNYIADFICYENRLVIEVDGGQHAGQEEDDKKRDSWFNLQGFRVLRFWNNEVLVNIEGVLEVIREDCLRHPPLAPPIKGRGIKKW